MTEIFVVVDPYQDDEVVIGLANTIAEARSLLRAYKAGDTPNGGGCAVIQLWQLDDQQGWRKVTEADQ